MFTSRKATTAHHSSPQTVLIEIPPSTQLDNQVVPAVLDYILQDLSSTLTRHHPARPNIVILALDRHPNQFEKICKRFAIPASSVLDGFSQWFPIHGNVSGTESLKKPKLVHVATISPTTNDTGSVAFELGLALDSSIHRNSEHRIVVIDSLSTILRYWSSVNTFLDLRDALSDSQLKSHPSHSMTIVVVFRAHDRSHASLLSLKRACETHVLLHQGKNNNVGLAELTGATRDAQDIVTLHVCRRKPSGRVQLDRIDARPDRKDVRLIDVTQGSAASVGDADAQSVQDEHRQQEQLMEQLGLSFRVSLSSSERELRAAAGLPYLHHDENLADQGLQPHPKSLQVGGENDDDDGRDDYDSNYLSSSDDELFSEDV